MRNQLFCVSLIKDNQKHNYALHPHARAAYLN